MAIEFRCPQCQKLLRVSDESAGAKAKCPSCTSVVDVPGAEQAAAGPPDLSAGVSTSNPFGGGQPAKPEPKPKPFAGDAENPYGSPTAVYQPPELKPSLSGEVVPTATDAGQIMGYAWEVWKANLGLLVGITVVLFAVNIGFAAVQGGTEAVFAQQGEPEIGQLLGGIISIFSSLIQLFLGIGQAQINLKLLRRQRADFGELFGGGALYLRALGASLLFVLMMFGGMILCIIPGIIVLVLFWPYFFLIVDEKAGATESLGMAMSLGQANIGTSILIWLVGMLIMFVGVLAVCVGVLFAAPLVSLMWATTYLMMSGQLQPHAKY